MSCYLGAKFSACIRGLRVTVSMIAGHIAAWLTQAEILAEYPYLETEDLSQALLYAAWRAEEWRSNTHSPT